MGLKAIDHTDQPATLWEAMHISQNNINTLTPPPFQRQYTLLSSHSLSSLHHGSRKTAIDFQLQGSAKHGYPRRGTTITHLVPFPTRPSTFISTRTRSTPASTNALSTARVAGTPWCTAVYSFKLTYLCRHSRSVLVSGTLEGEW